VNKKTLKTGNGYLTELYRKMIDDAMAAQREGVGMVKRSGDRN
jgi:hypothetical protein